MSAAREKADCFTIVELITRLLALLRRGRMVEGTGDRRGYDKARPRIDIAVKPCA